MIHDLPKLNYGLEALEPYLSKKTLEFHYGKHHQAYVNNLNNLVTGTPFENVNLEKIVREADGAIYNNGAQVWNHTFYFNGLSNNGAKQPKQFLLDSINNSFGSFDLLKEQFTKAALTLFGSGWVWLVRKNDHSLEIVQESNAGNPLRKGLTPILTCDVWEHAYYLDYQNKRPDYIQAFWNLVDWNIVSDRY
ncbi:MAG: superoxide dismutase [Bacteroidota bacterium]